MPKKIKTSPKTNKKISLSLIILSYNSQFWLKSLLESLIDKYLNKTKYQVKVVLVDNNSTDDSVDFIKKNYPQFELIQLSENIGFAAGNNAALKKVNTDYAMLLNNDTQFTDDTNLDILVDYLEQHPKAAVITPQVNLTNGDLDMACHRGEPTPWAFFTYFAKLEKLFPKNKYFAQYHQSFKDYTQVHEIDACSGAAMMVRKSAMDKVGLLDEQFFMYAEDIDWCRRFREQGFKIIYHPLVKIIHHKYKSGIKSESTVTSTKIKNYFYSTMLMYYDKYYKDKYPKILRFLLRVFLFIKKGGL